MAVGPASLPAAVGTPSHQCGTSSTAAARTSDSVRAATERGKGWLQGELPRRPLATKKTPGLCSYPQCTETHDEWHWLNGQCSSVRICDRHHSTLCRNQEERQSLSDALDHVLSYLDGIIRLGDGSPGRNPGTPSGTSDQLFHDFSAFPEFIDGLSWCIQYLD